MNKINTTMAGKYAGFSLIELMVAMTIGLFLVVGVMSVYVNGHRSQGAVDEQVDMVANARFALETISADIRQAGIYGRATATSKINNTSTMPAITGDCVASWTANYIFPVFAYNELNSYGSTCNSNYLRGDVLELRGSLRDPVTVLQNNMLYINSDVNGAQFFYGTTSPGISLLAKNYQYYVSAYYISANSNVVGDGIPSLHKVSLQPGGAISDQVMLSGVENMQVQIGLAFDDNDDGAPDRLTYVNPNNVTNWSLAKSVQIWLVIRPSTLNAGGITTTINTNIAGQAVTYTNPHSFTVAGGANDGIRRIVVSTVANLREL